jgi:hypothetical protein
MYVEPEPARSSVALSHDERRQILIAVLANLITAALIVYVLRGRLK